MDQNMNSLFYKTYLYNIMSLDLKYEVCGTFIKHKIVEINIVLLDKTFCQMGKQNIIKYDFHLKILMVLFSSSLLKFLLSLCPSLH